MGPSQLIILAIIATPVVILGRDAFDRRQARPQVLLALGVLLAILANIAITLAVGGTTPARIGANSQRQGSSQQCRSDERTLMSRGAIPPPASVVR
jgi:hypothetical protein